MRWFKFYGQDWLTDLKVRKLSLEDKMCFITLLCLASTADEGGVVRNCDETTLIELSNLRDNPYDTNNEYQRAIGCLERYKALQIVTLHDNGDVTVNNFDRRQGENLSNAERQKAYRERLKTTPKERNSRNVTRYNDSNARIEENRIEENRIETIYNSDSFNKFWTSYPKKIGKGAAEKSWEKLKPPLDVVLTAIESQRTTDQWSKDSGKFIPHPATWLNQKRWEDEIKVVTSSKFSKYDS